MVKNYLKQFNIVSKIPKQKKWRFHFGEVFQRLIQLSLVLVYTFSFFLFEIYGEAVVAQALGHNRFKVQNIAIENNVLLSKQDILSQLKIKANTNILTCDLKSWHQTLLKMPQVRDAIIQKVFPGKIVIKLLERYPLFRLKIGGELIDKEGKLVPVSSGLKLFSHLPVLDGFNLTTYNEISLEDKDRFFEIEKLVEHIQMLLRPFDEEVDLVKRNNSNIDVKLSSGVTLKFPNQSPLEKLKKLDVVYKDIKKNNQRVKIINLQFERVFVSV